MEVLKTLLPWLALITINISLAVMVAKLNFGQFGDDAKGKLIAFLRVQINIFIVAGLTIILAVRFFNYISQDLFIALLVGGLSVLGFNLNSSTKALKQMKFGKSDKDANEKNN